MNPKKVRRQKSVSSQELNNSNISQPLEDNSPYVFQKEKINYELLGNGDSHVHWHIFPRRNNDIGKKGPVWWLDPNEMWNDKYILTDSERYEMISRLQTKINELISFGHYE